MEKSKKKKVNSSVGGGEDCAQCRRPMERKWTGKPRANQSYYYYVYWDHCADCNYTRHYAAAKRLVAKRPEGALIYFRGKFIKPEKWK